MANACCSLWHVVSEAIQPYWDEDKEVLEDCVRRLVHLGGESEATSRLGKSGDPLFDVRVELEGYRSMLYMEQMRGNQARRELEQLKELIRDALARGDVQLPSNEVGGTLDL